ncbi:MAG TPA: type III secretion system cytoplasmic ring protein SctQ [Rhabdochlamydiaceae bacterium]|nr:type III secretion system cytoplasmic ring protein SctQ [Rhabdochlamydiaceae bacterium]
MTQVAYPWIRKVEETLQQAKIIPMWGGFPPFPWKEASSQLATLFQVKNFKLSAQQTAWQEKDKLLTGMGDHPFVTPFILTPLTGSGYLIMPQEDMAKLSSYLLTKDHSFKGFSDRSLKEGFYIFVLLRVLQTLDALHPFGDLSPKLLEFSSLPKEGAFCIDLSIAINSLKLWARLLCPKELHQAFLSYFAQTKPSLLTEELAKQIEVPLRLEVGNSVLKLSEWENAKEGDFIVLDRCTFDPAAGKGSGNLTLETTPLFQVRIKGEEVKIIDYAFYQEEKTAMESTGEEAFVDEDFEEESAEQEPLWKQEKSSESIISSKEIPIHLTIEVGRLVMSVEKLLQLKAGNVLELPIKPEEGVDVTVGGKKIAKGELLKLGEVLGVRILQINDHG